MVSIGSIISMGITLLICFAVPLILLWVIRRRYQASLKSFLVGMIAFIIATQILEAPINAYFLLFNETTVQWFASHPMLYALYGGFMAGLFEETARYLSYKWALKKQTRIQDSLSYGVGHGGIEAMLIVGTTYINNLVLSLMINQGFIENLGLSTELQETVVTQLTQVSPILFSLAGYERLMTLIIQIGLSVIVFKAIRERKIRYYAIAILIHALLDFPAALAQLGFLNAYMVEGIVTLFAVGFMIFITKQLKVYRQDLTKVEDEELEKYKQAGY